MRCLAFGVKVNGNGNDWSWKTVRSHQKPTVAPDVHPAFVKQGDGAGLGPLRRGTSVIPTAEYLLSAEVWPEGSP